MSHTALRRVMIRLLHDPTLAAALRSDPDRALAGVDLTAHERSWLVQTPAAAWRTDPERPMRVLAALAEEFPATLVLADGDPSGFFAAEEFHAAVQARGSLACAFGAYLGRATDPRVRALAALESAVAEVRRARPAAQAGGHGWLRLSPRAAVVRVPAGTLALAAAVRAGDLSGTVGNDVETVLVFASGSGDVSLETLEPELAALLELAAAGATRAQLEGVARLHGAEAGEDAEILERLVADGLLIGADGPAV